MIRFRQHQEGGRELEQTKLAPAGSFCWNAECPDYGQVGHGNMRKFGRTDKGVQRYQCKMCQKTYVETKGTVFHGSHHSQETILECLVMLADRQLGSLHAVHNFNAVTFLPKRDLQQLSDRFLVIDNEDMGHLASGFLDCGFCSLHNTSPNSRELDDKLSAAVFLGYHADFSTVCLNNLIDNRKPKTGASFET